METIYANQLANTTVAYVDNTPMRCVPGNSVAIEQAMKAEFIDKAHFFSARIVFGSGRVALIFLTRSI